MIVILSSDSATLFERYIEAANLSAGDYLFPSAGNAKRPMSTEELNRIVQPYLLEALTARTKTFQFT
jgi:hypothetical protein